MLFQWYRYGELTLRYQDTIVGHTYGHMNVAHFFMIGAFMHSFSLFLPRLTY